MFTKKQCLLKMILCSISMILKITRKKFMRSICRGMPKTPRWSLKFWRQKCPTAQPLSSYHSKKLLLLKHSLRAKMNLKSSFRNSVRLCRVKRCCNRSKNNLCRSRLTGQPRRSSKVKISWIMQEQNLLISCQLMIQIKIWQQLQCPSNHLIVLWPKTYFLSN